MKNIKFVLLLMLTFCVSSVFAQVTMSSECRQYFTWDSTATGWEYATIENTPSFFEFNKEFTMFTHITLKIRSTYRVYNEEYFEEFDRYEYDIVSDVGNRYIMIIDVENDNIRMIYKEEDTSVMIRFPIKSVYDTSYKKL